MEARNRQYIVSPVFDFILLGGGSLVVFPIVMYFWPVTHLHQYKLYSVFIAISVFFSYLVNFPHFMYSYQLMYHDFSKKVSGAIDKSIQQPYIWASIIVPIVMVFLFAYCYVKRDYILFGFLANIGALISGWHFAKQGFGVLIVTSVYQKIYYNAWERFVLLWNANLFWVYIWIVVNTGTHKFQFWHARFYTLGFPSFIQKILFYVVCASALYSIVILASKYMRESIFPPISGLVGYGTAIYYWLFLLRYVNSTTPIHPIAFLVPSMHAIQYMTIVFRMKQNEVMRQRITVASWVIFILTGLILGVLSFVAIPRILDKTLTQGFLYHSILFVTIFAVYINIHHFFIDSVIWRKESSEVKEYLYGVH